MDSNQFTIKTQEVIQAAQELAQAEGHQAIENAHLLKGIFIKDHDVVRDDLLRISRARASKAPRTRARFNVRTNAFICQSF